MATATDIHTHARAQCSHASVGLAQARPNHNTMSTVMPSSQVAKQWLISTEVHIKIQADVMVGMYTQNSANFNIAIGILDVEVYLNKIVGRRCIQF